MKNKFLKTGLISSLLILSISAFWFFGYKNLNTTVHYIDSNFIADFDNDKKVLWATDNVFVWKVIENLWPADIKEWGSKIPSTLFNVEVIYNIKGKTKGIITVKQQAGYDKYGDLYIPEDTQYMEEWQTYLLATKWDSYTVMAHPNGSHLLESDSKKTKSEIKKLVKNSQKIQDWRNAYINEEIYENGYKISSEKNLYKDLKKEDKEKFIDIENGFVN